MKNEAYTRYLNDETYRAAVLAAARLARTEAIRRFIVGPLLALMKSPPRRQTRMLRRSYC